MWFRIWSSQKYEIAQKNYAGKIIETGLRLSWCIIYSISLQLLPFSLLAEAGIGHITWHHYLVLPCGLPLDISWACLWLRLVIFGIWNIMHGCCLYVGASGTYLKSRVRKRLLLIPNDLGCLCMTSCLTSLGIDNLEYILPCYVRVMSVR